jgi:antagonist of KipI
MGRGRRIRVLRAGLFTTVQDTGRFGFQSRGVPPAGPMDSSSHRLANLLVGNAREAATLEMTLLGPEVLMEDAARIAVCGAEFALTAAGRAVPCNQAVDVAAGTAIRFGPRGAGARAYLAVDGGIDVPIVLGSRATHVVSRMGGLAGRRLQEGDVLPVGPSVIGAARRGRRPFDMPAGGASIRVMMGPHAEMFAEPVLRTFVEATFVVSNDSDRMAYRLTGPALPWTGGELISDVLPNGGIQVPGSGQPILLMADRATAGGYPIVATVIAADLPIAGQLAPGDWIRFVPCTPAEAMAALIARERRLIG